MLPKLAVRLRFLRPLDPSRLAFRRPSPAAGLACQRPSDQPVVAERICQSPLAQPVGLVRDRCDLDGAVRDRALGEPVRVGDQQVIPIGLPRWPSPTTPMAHRPIDSPAWDAVLQPRRVSVPQVVRPPWGQLCHPFAAG
jgi:hypothetical protein